MKRQYIGNLGKIENGIVAVTAYGVWQNITFPITFEVYKPEERLEPGDVYRSKPQIAAQMIRELRAMGFKFKLVLADCLYGQSKSNFISVLHELKLEYVVAIRSDYGVWLPQGQRVRQNRWRGFERIFSNGKQENRYIRKIIFGKRRAIQYYYGLRNWIEYGLKHSKNELGWADFRVTDYSQIEKWWEVVMSAYLMVSLHSDVLNSNDLSDEDTEMDKIRSTFSKHAGWDSGKGWKNILNNLRLVIQPFIFFNLIKPWLKVFSIPQLSSGFSTLITIMNLFKGAVPRAALKEGSQFSSA